MHHADTAPRRRSARRAAAVALVLSAVAAPSAASVVLADPATAAYAAAKAAPQSKARTAATTTSPAPAQTLVKDADGTVVARFTKGARTVVLTGPSRTFAEATTTTARVTTSAWVRLLDEPFTGTVDQAWLTAARQDRSADVLADAAAFLPGAPDVRDATGTRVTSDATYGPVEDGVRKEGSDWNDYQGVTATYGSTSDRPEAAQLGSLDCSGYVRVLFGVRAGVPMSLATTGSTLPRRAVQMEAGSPGVRVLANTGARPASLTALQTGDLVFFDAATDDGTAIDHVGIYLGTDSAGRPRFVSSRKKADGPTMGDVGGASVLSGTGHYAKAFRAARRV